MKRKVSIREFIYIAILLAAIVFLFVRFSMQTGSRTKEQNMAYAADSAQLKAEHLDKELNIALRQIDTYAYFVGEGLTEPAVTGQMLKRMEESSHFDAIMFTDINGIDHTSDGQTAAASGRRFYNDGVKGNSGIDIVFDPQFFNKTTACFYAPVHFNGQMIGILRGVFTAEEYLKDMLATTYFGEEAQVFLCEPDGRVIASSDGKKYEGYLIDALTESKMIDSYAAGRVRTIFDNRGTGVFVCDRSSKTDNICVTYLPQNDFVFVQTFPKKITQSMIADGNSAGIQLEILLVVMFAAYIAFILFRVGRRRRQLEKENREMGYIRSGANTLFSRYAMVDLEEDTYTYLAGTKPLGGAIPRQRTVSGSCRAFCRIHGGGIAAGTY